MLVVVNTKHERNIIRYFTKIYNYSFYLMPLILFYVL